jgi:hypothetical protein
MTAYSNLYAFLFAPIFDNDRSMLGYIFGSVNFLHKEKKPRSRRKLRVTCARRFVGRQCNVVETVIEASQSQAMESLSDGSHGELTFSHDAVNG